MRDPTPRGSAAAPARRPTRSPSPTQAAARSEAVRRARYDAAHGRASRRGREDPDPTLDPARWSPHPAALSVGCGGGGASRRLPVPRRVADRVPAEPDRPRADASQDPARLRCGAGVSGVRRHRPRRGRRARHGGCEPGEDEHDPRERLLYGRARTGPADARGSRRRPAPALAEHPPAQLDQGPEAGPRPRRQGPEEGRLQVHGEGARLHRGRGDQHDQVPLQPGPGDRGVDLHAARHAAAETRRGPAVPAPSRARRRCCRGSRSRWRATCAGSSCSR